MWRAHREASVGLGIDLQALERLVISAEPELDLLVREELLALPEDQVVALELDLVGFEVLAGNSPRDGRARRRELREVHRPLTGCRDRLSWGPGFTGRFFTSRGGSRLRAAGEHHNEADAHDRV